MRACMMALKLTRSENCIMFQVLENIGTTVKRSPIFYTSKLYIENDIRNLKDSRGFFDGDDTLRLYQEDELTFIRLRFFDNKSGYNFYIYTSKLADFIFGSSEMALIPVTRPTIKSKIVLQSRKNLGDILQNKMLKKKFGRAIARLADCNNEEVHVSDDFVDFSFYFVKYYKGERSYNGGLIFHKDYTNPTDLSKGKYSVHT